MALANPAPGELEQVRAFVNTWDAETGEERFTSPDALVGYLREAGLLEGEAEAGPRQVEEAIRLREALRAILLHHDGLELDPGAGPELEAAARRAELAVRFDEHGSVVREPLAGGVEGALGRLLAIVAAAQADGTWVRLKVCPADDCQWAFFDRSRNRSAVWCDMGTCGNRAKVRSYRERRAPRGANASA